MADTPISLKRSSKEKTALKKGLREGPGVLGAEDYPYGTSFEVEGEHADKMFGDDVPASNTPVKFHGRGYVHRSSTDSVDGEKRSRVGVQMTHLCVHCDGDDEEGGNNAAPRRKGLRNIIKRSAKQVGEDLGDEEE